MAVSYILPLQRAWYRARLMLFLDFGVDRWLVLGFAAFLAGLVDTGIFSSWRTRWSLPPRPGHLTEFSFLGLPHRWLDNGWLLALIPLLVVGVVILLVLLWVGSRGKFVFLDDTVHCRAAIVEPWKRFQALGDSLFVWRVGLWLAGFVVLALAGSPVAALLRDTSLDGLTRGLVMIPVLLSAALASVLAVVFALLVLFLESFVVPLMYSRNLTCSAAWRFLLPLLRRHVVEFGLYALFVVVLWVLLLGLFVVVAAVTCCIVWPILILLALPYIKSVLMLPLSVTFRLFTVEFLAQFGPEYFTLPPLPEPPPARP